MDELDVCTSHGLILSGFGWVGKPRPGGLETFIYPTSGQQVRTVTVDGEPCFVPADVCAILGHTNPSKAIADHVDPEDVVRATLTIREGSRMVERERPLVNESGLYALIFGSKLPAAKAFKRWVTAEVLPSIRRTGSYSVAQSAEERMAIGLKAAQELLEQKDKAIAELAPKAEHWDVLASAEGDYSVGDAAKILSRDPAIDVGQNRLFKKLAELGWAFRQRGDNAWRVYQTAAQAGWLSEIPQTHYHPRTGQLVVDPPQVRVTARGLAELRRRLGGSVELPIAA